MVEINNFTRSKINEIFARRVSDFVLRKESKENYSFSLAFVGEKRIRMLNKKFLKKDRSTDVLSFSDIGGDDKKFLGEIVICPGKTDNKTRALIHGILHLLGYDHEKSDIMLKKEDKYLKIFDDLLVVK